MTNKTLVFDDICSPRQMACSIANKFMSWDQFRASKKAEWDEIQRYIFAVDTSHTSNAALPWGNKTTIPKLCQIRDNLHANYMASLFPKRKWLTWFSDTEADEAPEKKKNIESYMGWVNDRNEFYTEMTKIVLDYIDYGNAFATVDWVDNRVRPDAKRKEQVGFVGPMVRRISPLDLVFDPTATTFSSSPKIIRSLVSIGEVKDILESLSQNENLKADAEELWSYMREIRAKASSHTGEWSYKDNIYNVAGFGNFVQYLASNTVEILTFYGDLYDSENDVYYKNHVIKVVDRHRILSIEPNPSYFGMAPIYHVGWRVRPDNLWSMGPLDNLVGMQYRIDHLENMKADVFDLNVRPLFKIKGYVEPFDWVPGEKIILGDDGDVELIRPDYQILQVNTEIEHLERKMEEMAGSPKEAMGFRTPGEKTKYEVQRLENAAGRVFQAKIVQFERELVENLINAQLELGRRLVDTAEIRVFDDELQINTFRQLTPQDITGNGRIRPLAARHFAEQAQIVQDINSFYSSAVGQDPGIRNHWSGIKLSKMMESLLDVEDYKLVSPNVRLAEQADSERMLRALQEQVQTETETATGFLPGDTDAQPSMGPQSGTRNAA